MLASRLLARLAIAAIFALCALPAKAGPAGDLIAKLNESFIAAMQQGPELGYEGRHALLEPVVGEAFDFALMARVTAGRFWKEFSDDQKALLVDRFRAYSLAAYAARFKAFSGESFEILGEEPKPQNTILVQNQIRLPEGEPIRIDYLVQDQGGLFKIIDIFVRSSISEVAVRRSDFTETLEREGFDALIVRLELAVDDFAAGKEVAP